MPISLPEIGGVVQLRHKSILLSRRDCTEEELCARLERVRQRCLDLPFHSVGIVQRLEAIHNPVVITLFRKEGPTLPEAVAKRLEAVESDPDHGMKSLAFALDAASHLSKSEQNRYLAPALDLMQHTDLWKEDDLPESVGKSESIGDFTPLTIYRGGIAFEFANILLRYGYYLVLDPGPGCENLVLNLSTYGKHADAESSDSLFWYGNGFTKTQYAKDFIRAHETVCHALDCVQEEGLLLSASDTCGYYATRKWKDASEQVNAELLFARQVGEMMGLAVGNLREEGVTIHTVVDNASKAQPVDFSSALSHEQDDEPQE
jgi:hypothetical protein